VHGRERGAVSSVEEIRCRAVAPTSSPLTSPTPRALRVPKEVATSTPGQQRRVLVWGPTEPLRSRPSMRCSPQCQGAVPPRRRIAPACDTWDRELINISSMAGRLGLAGGAAYAPPSGAGVVHSGMAAEYSPRGIRVNAVAPGSDSIHGPRRGISSTRSAPPRR